MKVGQEEKDLKNFVALSVLAGVWQLLRAASSGRGAVTPDSLRCRIQTPHHHRASRGIPGGKHSSRRREEERRGREISCLGHTAGTKALHALLTQSNWFCHEMKESCFTRVEGGEKSRRICEAQDSVSRATALLSGALGFRPVFVL